MKPVEFSGIDFEDVKGHYRTIRQCPLTKREELRVRLNRLYERFQQADPNLTMAALYDEDSYFRFLSLRCLELCGIAPDWVDVNMMAQFLLPHKRPDGTPSEGVLVELNFPPAKRVEVGGKAMTYAEALATIWAFTEDLEKAIALADSVPADLLLETLDARGKQIRDANPEEREKALKKEWQRKARQDLENGSTGTQP